MGALWQNGGLSFMMEKTGWEWATNIFTFIGVVVCILITLIAVVWLTCFFVKLLIKTFSVRVGKSYDLMVEDITKKSEAKKERNEKKRQAKLDHKMELLNMKLESKARVHEMKKKKLEDSLEAKERNQKVKLFGENADSVKNETEKADEKPEKPTKAKKEATKEPEEVVDENSQNDEQSDEK